MDRDLRISTHKWQIDIGWKEELKSWLIRKFPGILKSGMAGKKISKLRDLGPNNQSKNGASVVYQIFIDIETRNLKNKSIIFLTGKVGIITLPLLNSILGIAP